MHRTAQTPQEAGSKTIMLCSPSSAPESELLSELLDKRALNRMVASIRSPAARAAKSPSTGSPARIDHPGF